MNSNQQNNMKHFQNQIYAAIREQGKKHVLHFQNFDKQKMQSLNGQGYGIYITANSFDGKRSKDTLIKLNAVVGDLDVAKDSENVASDELDNRKKELVDTLSHYCPPSYIVSTKNGIQPWYYIDEDRIDPETINQYVGVMSGLIDISKEMGGLGDETKDVARLWRMPEYLHQKSAPYLVKGMEGSGHVWALSDLKSFFWREILESQKQAIRFYKKTGNPLLDEMKKIDIREIVMRAGEELGDRITFGKDNHLILNGERRGTFLGPDGDYIATQSSVYPIKGNHVTVVACMLGISNYKAVQWICDRFDENPLKKIYG
jgi:hypothetical protein